MELLPSRPDHDDSRLASHSENRSIDLGIIERTRFRNR